MLISFQTRAAERISHSSSNSGRINRQFFMKSEMRQTPRIKGTNNEDQVVPVSHSKTADMLVESILLRNNRLFAAFLGVGLLVAALIIVVMFLRWDF